MLSSRDSMVGKWERADAKAFRAASIFGCTARDPVSRVSQKRVLVPTTLLLYVELVGGLVLLVESGSLYRICL
jgi:hypothetical protein